jgi:hypothetical protein
MPPGRLIGKSLVLIGATNDYLGNQTDSSRQQPGRSNESGN